MCIIKKILKVLCIVYITIATIIGSINIWLILNEVIISYTVRYDMS